MLDLLIAVAPAVPTIDLASMWQNIVRDFTHIGSPAALAAFGQVLMIDITKSGTRKEELLLKKDVLSKVWVLRRILMQMGTVDAMQFLLDKMKDAKSNEDFFASMNQ